MNMVDPKHIQPNDGHDYFKCGCVVDTTICSDVKEGEFKFDGPATVYGICHLTKSYLIVKMDDECEINWNSVWMNGRTQLDCEGTFKVKYKWDACSEEEPKFGITHCTCCDKRG